jgi:hypothetical protein
VAVKATTGQTLDFARSQLGISEHPPASNCQPYSTFWQHPCEAWCANFASYVLKHGNVLDVPYSALARRLADGYQAAGRWYKTPRPGDLAFFVWPGDTVIHHVEIVESIRGDSANIPGGHVIVDIGGNVGNKVVRTVRRSHVVGYGRPAYGRASAVPHPPPPPGGSDVILDDLPNLRNGDGQHNGKRYHVLTLQGLLNARAGAGQQQIDIDGEFGAVETEPRVKQEQHDHGLPQTGVVDDKTWTAILTGRQF